MKILPYLLVLTLLCLLPADTNNEKKVRKKRFAALLPLILLRTLPLGLTIFKELRGIWSDMKEQSVQRATLGQLVSLSSRLENLETNMKDVVETAISTLLRTFPKVVKLELILHDLTLIKNQINFADEQMRSYLVLSYENLTKQNNDPFIHFRNLRPPNMTVDFTPLEQMSSQLSDRGLLSKRIMDRFTMIDFATWATGHTYNSLPSLLRRMHDLVVRGERNGLFDKIYDVSTEMSSNVCALRHSPYQTMYNLYISIAVAELKGNSVLQFAYTILRMYKIGKFTTESTLALQAFGKNAKEKLESLTRVLHSSDRSIYNCDAPKQVDGKTYTYLLRFLQMYIENEINLNRGRTCWKDCGYYSPKTKYYGCYKNKFCAKQPKCGGPVLNCRSAAYTTRICRSTRKDRRYDWIKYEGGKLYGKDKFCWDENYFKVENWWYWLFWRCSYCACLCDDKSWESERYFNLRAVTSDREKNKIVTGVRIVKQKQLIHLQIQEGVLNSLGRTNTSSLSWKPVEKYTVWDKNVKNYRDYFTMDYDWRALDTNEMTALPGYVVTGVRFRKRGSHVDIDVHVTPFNFTSGQLLLKPSNHSYWISKNKTHPQTGGWRSQISLWRPDVPIGLGPHSLNSRKNQYILFQETDYEKDAGQSTVPYFDSQPLTSEGFALSGFGLIHRGRSGSGGFIAPKLISYDFAAHLTFNKTA